MGDHSSPTPAKPRAAAQGPEAAVGFDSGFGPDAGAAGVASRLAGVTLGGSCTAAPARAYAQPLRSGPQAQDATAGIVSGLAGVTLGGSSTDAPAHARVQQPRPNAHAGGTASAGIASELAGVTLGSSGADATAGTHAPSAAPAGFQGSPGGAAPRAGAPAHARAPSAAPAAFAGSPVRAGPHADLAARFAAAVNTWDAGSARFASAVPEHPARDAGAAAAGGGAGFVFSAQGAQRSRGMRMLGGCQVKAIRKVVSRDADLCRCRVSVAGMLVPCTEGGVG